VPRLLDKPLVFVLGKGGVGRSTVAASLALVASRRGRRTILAEVAGQDQASRVLSRRAADPFEEHEVTPGLWSISIDPEHATREYLRDQLPVRTMADAVAGSDTFSYFAAAAPGLHELVTIGKIWELAQRQRRTPGAEPYDLVVVDAPASGHAVALMRTPRTFADVARVGPIARQAGKIDAFVSRPGKAGTVAVALPTDMAVNETIALAGPLRDQVGLGLDRVVLNGLYPARFTRDEVRVLRRDRNGLPEHAAARAAVRAAVSEAERAKDQRGHARRLRHELDAPVIKLPFVFAPELGREELEMLADRLEEKL
jgi:Anion-transporting ATPase